MTKHSFSYVLWICLRLVQAPTYRCENTMSCQAAHSLATATMQLYQYAVHTKISRTCSACTDPAASGLCFTNSFNPVARVRVAKHNVSSRSPVLNIMEAMSVGNAWKLLAIHRKGLSEYVIRHAWTPWRRVRWRMLQIPASYIQSKQLTRRHFRHYECSNCSFQ